MESFEEKKQKAITAIKKIIKLIEYSVLTFLLFFVVSVFWCIWNFGKLSIRLLGTSVVLIFICVLLNYIFKDTLKDFENLKEK